MADEWVNVWTHRPYAPFIMELCVDATVNSFSKLFPSRITRGGSYWRERVENYFYVESELDATVEAIAAKTLENPAFIYVFLENSLEKAKQLNVFSSRFKRRAFAGESALEIAASIEEFAALFKEMYSYGTVVMLVGYKQDNALYEATNDILKKKTKAKPQAFAKHLLALTRPLKKLKTQEQERAVLKLALRAVELKLDSINEIRDAFAAELAALVEKFGWLSFNLCDSIAWDAKHYAGLVFEKTLAGRGEIEKQMRFNEDYDAHAQREFEESSASLSLDERERALFKAVSDVGYYKWAREYEFVQAFYNAKRAQDELGARIGLSPLQANYVLAREWKNAVALPHEFKRKTAARLENCLVLCVQGQETRILEGAAAGREYAALRFANEKIETAAADARQLRGTPACAGQAKGFVKIINSLADAGKMREGDVLVSAATSPDLVPAMKKASAIVTSEGGITCHAAIVSRELGIPCVVGVRGVHKILRDGELVEVDASHGLVKRLSASSASND